MKRLREIVDDHSDGIPSISNVMLLEDGTELLTLREGKWIKGRFDRNIRLDRQTHRQGEGQPHAHVYGRKGNEIVAVNLDGTPSHGKKGRLHPDDAAALSARGYKIPPDRIIEWWSLAEPVTPIFG